ncbi:hypothetical protein [Streptomyces atratus]|uniref:hypothetical protein n=1 Tax=Streptomyces atratus TaxID=1893 RepID=UPI0018E5A6F1
MTAAAAGSRTVLVAAVAAVLAVPAGSPALVHVAVVLWELGRGCAPTLLQTAAGEAAGDEADAAQGAQAMLVTLWNAAMAGGGVVGGVLLDPFGSTALPWSALVLMLPVATVVAAARAHGFRHGARECDPVTVSERVQAAEPEGGILAGVTLRCPLGPGVGQGVCPLSGEPVAVQDLLWVTAFPAF